MKVNKKPGIMKTKGALIKKSVTEMKVKNKVKPLKAKVLKTIPTDELKDISKLEMKKKPKVLMEKDKKPKIKDKETKTNLKTTLKMKTKDATNQMKNKDKTSLKDVKKVAGKVKSKEKGKNKSSVVNFESIKDIDPEFYKFLKKNDKKLLEFNALDTDDEEEEQDIKIDDPAKKKYEDQNESNEGRNDSSDENEGEDEEKFHKPSDKLEVASDESDFEDEEDLSADGSQKITLNLLRQWEMQLQQPNPSIDIIRKVIQAFNSALASISAEAFEMKIPSAYKVAGGAAFNGVVQLCVLHLQPALTSFLGLQKRSNIPLQKCKKWVKVRGCLRYYLTDLIRLVEQVSSPNILSVLLKHLHQMAGMIAPFTALGKNILKRLIVLWGQGEENVRVLAFLCILKITRNQQGTMLQHVLKAMYLSYVRNSKFVSPNTLPGINFMRRSLVEMFALDLNVSYQHAFLYIRQLAIHLRNAVILKKKDSFQAVYNWQYINSLRLWSDLLGTTSNKPQLQPLIYPLVTITLGVIRLIPTAQYFPLRFHCIQLLISLAKKSHIFIPILPLILEVLRSNTFNKKHLTVSMRPIQFTCLLRLNKGQLAENGFRDEVIEQVLGLTLEYLAHESTSLAFCDLIVPSVMALKSYIKQCRNANYSRKLKQLLDKIQENSRFIEQERQKITFGLKDSEQIQAWESHIHNKGTPLEVYYNSWVKIHETKKRRQAAQIDSINSDYDLPTIKKTIKSKTISVKNENGEVELFPSDSEEETTKLVLDDGVINEEDQPQPKKLKKKKQKKPKVAVQPNLEPEIPIEEDTNDNVDIVKDLNLDDW